MNWPSATGGDVCAPSPAIACPLDRLRQRRPQGPGRWARTARGRERVRRAVDTIVFSDGEQRRVSGVVAIPHRGAPTSGPAPARPLVSANRPSMAAFSDCPPVPDPEICDHAPRRDPLVGGAGGRAPAASRQRRVQWIRTETSSRASLVTNGAAPSTTGRAGQRPTGADAHHGHSKQRNPTSGLSPTTFPRSSGVQVSHAQRSTASFGPVSCDRFA